MDRQKTSIDSMKKYRVYRYYNVGHIDKGLIL